MLLLLLFFHKTGKSHHLLATHRLNILVLGGENGSVELYAYGMYKIATLTEVRLSTLGLDLCTPVSHVLQHLLCSVVSVCGVYFVFWAK